MLHLARADPESQRPERPMGRRVTVPADGRAPRQREPLLGPDDVHDSLPLVLHPEVPQAEVGDVRLHLQDLGPAGGLLDEGRDVHQRRAVGRGDVVVDRGQRAVRPADGAVGEAEPLEGLGGGHLVDEVAVDVEQAREAVVLDDVVVPYLVVEGRLEWYLLSFESTILGSSIFI